MSLRQEPEGWNPPGPHQLCTCEHEKSIHGDGEYFTTCQTIDCDCPKFVAALQSPEARAKFREEMDAGLRCRLCGSGFHKDAYHDQPTYGGPVCHYPDCGYEFDASSVAEAVIDELAERYGVKLMKNPDWDRKAEKVAWAAGLEYGVPEYIERPLKDRRNDTCMTTFRASDGHLSLRTLTYIEIGDVVRSVIDREVDQP